MVSPLAQAPAVDADAGADSLAEAVHAERRRLEGLPASVLVTKLLQSTQKADKAAAMLTAAQRKNKNLRKQLANAQKSKEMAVAARKSAEEKNMFELRKLGKQKCGRADRWSLQSRFSIGLRSCLSTVSAGDFGMLSMVDISRQTVLRAQCMTGASIIALMKSFCCEGLSLALDAGQSSNEWSLFAVGFRSDATNGSIWHRQKLHVCEASAMFLSDPEQLKLGNFEEAMSRRSCVSLGFIFMESDTYTLYPLNLSI